MKKYAVTENGVITKVINSNADPVPSNYTDMTTADPHHITTDEAQTAYDLFKTVNYCVDNQISILPRGGGTSQCGQTVNHSLVIDNSKYFNNCRIPISC